MQAPAFFFLRSRPPRIFPLFPSPTLVPSYIKLPRLRRRNFEGVCHSVDIDGPRCVGALDEHQMMPLIIERLPAHTSELHSHASDLSSVPLEPATAAERPQVERTIASAVDG